ELQVERERAPVRAVLHLVEALAQPVHAVQRDGDRDHRPDHGQQDRHVQLRPDGHPATPAVGWPPCCCSCSWGMSHGSCCWCSLSASTSCGSTSARRTWTSRSRCGGSCSCSCCTCWATSSSAAGLPCAVVVQTSKLERELEREQMLRGEVEAGHAFEALEPLTHGVRVDVQRPRAGRDAAS